MRAAPGWSGIPVAADLRVRIRGTDAPMPGDVAAIVSEIWDRECARRPALFNGRVFCADAIGRHEIVGHWTEYRRVLAQLRRPALFDVLGIRSLAVNGLVACADGLVLGRRHGDAVYFPGHWQAAPAGSVEARSGDEVDLPGQLLAELQEELGLAPADIVAMMPVLAIEHAGSRIVDVGFLLETPLGFPEIERLHDAGGNAEYDALQAVPPATVSEFLEREDPTLMPSARLMLGAWIGAQGAGTTPSGPGAMRHPSPGRPGSPG